jgi:hypothetical protein
METDRRGKDASQTSRFSMEENRLGLKKYLDYRIVLGVYVFLLVFMMGVTWFSMERTFYRYGNNLMYSGIAVIGLFIMGIYFRGRRRGSDFDYEPVPRDAQVRDRLHKMRGTSKFYKPYISFILGGLFAALTGYLIILIVVD